MKKVKKALKRLAPKVLNFFIILLMLFQPVGTPGMLVAIAQDTGTTTVDSVPAPDPTPPPAPKAEEPKVEAIAPASAPAPDPTPAPAPDPTPIPEPITVTPPAPVLDPAPVTDPTVPTTPDPAKTENLGSTEGTSGTIDPAAVIEIPPITTETPVITPAPEAAPVVEAPVAPKKEEGTIDAVVVEKVKAKSLDLDKIDPANVEQTAQLATDKADYAPTDTAIITGTGFTPGETYTLVISSKDKPPVTKTVQITADENGQFVYAYQLDGNYRPDYKVESKDLTGTVIAAVTFTDSPGGTPEIEYNNFEGEIAPQDSNNWTNGNISGYKEGDTIRFRVELDSDVGALSGHLFIGFTSDPACRFFKFQNPTDIAIDFDRTTDVIDSGTGFSAVFTPPLTQNGSDAVADFAIISSSANQVRLNFTLQVDDNAAACANGSSQHVQIDHVSGDVKSSGNKALPIPATAVAPVTDITVSKTGTASASIGGAVSYTATVTNLDATPAASVVVSDTLPTGITGTTATYDVDPISAGGNGSCSLVDQVFTCSIGTLGGNDGDTTGAEPDVAVITVNGTINNNTQLCSTSLTNNVSVTTTTLESNYQNNSAQASTNIDRCLGTIIVHKDVQGPTGEDIADTSSTFKVEMDGNTEQNIKDNETVTYSNVSSGSHTITESLIPSGYAVYGISTTAGGLGNTSGLPVNVPAGGSVDVYVTNRQQNATITVVKNVLNPDGGEAADTHQFTANVGSQADTITEGQNAVFTVAPGTYTITEDPDTNYELVSITPDQDSQTSGTQVTVGPGGQQTVTVTNKQKKAAITVYKDVVAPDGTTDVSDTHAFTAQLNGGNNQSISEGYPATYNINPATITISELTDADYTNLGCRLVTGALATSFAVGSNDQISVTCKNQQKNATVTVEKNVVNSDGTTEVSDNNTFTVTLDGTTKDFSENSPASFTVIPGTYGATEAPELNYTFVSDNGPAIVYSNGSATITVVNKQNPGEISGYKYGADGSTGLSGWTIKLLTCSDPISCLVASVQTDSSGYYEFTDLLTGSYRVQEELQSGWTNLSSLYNDVTINPGTESETTTSLTSKMLMLKLAKKLTLTGT